MFKYYRYFEDVKQLAHQAFTVDLKAADIILEASVIGE
jgi:hypothetical protein